MNAHKVKRARSGATGNGAPSSSSLLTREVAPVEVSAAAVVATVAEVAASVALTAGFAVAAGAVAEVAVVETTAAVVVVVWVVASEVAEALAHR